MTMYSLYCAKKIFVLNYFQRLRKINLFMINRLEVIVLVDEILAQESCGVTRRIKRSVEKICVVERFLIKSIKDNKDYIEQVKTI